MLRTTSTKNRRKRCPIAKQSPLPTHRQLLKDSCSINIIPCAAPSFKQVGYILKGRQLKQKEYNSLNKTLMTTYYREPLEASYTVNMTIDGIEYAFKLQPERHRKVAVFQAICITYKYNDPRYELITNGNILSSLLELFIYQEVKI